MSTTVVVIVDMQRSFLGKFWFIWNRGLVNRQKHLLNYCAAQDIPVIVLEYSGYGVTIKPVMREVQNVPRHEVVYKSNSDGFEGTRLCRTLNSYKASHIVLTGVNKDVCILHTAQGAIEHGFVPVEDLTLMRNTERLRYEDYVSAYIWRRDTPIGTLSDTLPGYRQP